jgi:hypothetical protein
MFNSCLLVTSPDDVNPLMPNVPRSFLRYVVQLHRDWKRAKINKYFLPLNAVEQKGPTQNVVSLAQYVFLFRQITARSGKNSRRRRRREKFREKDGRRRPINRIIRIDRESIDLSRTIRQARK